MGAALGDRFGRKRMFMIGLAVFTGASAMAALAPVDRLAECRTRPCRASAERS
jgi:MFS family permease